MKKLRSCLAVVLALLLVCAVPFAAFAQVREADRPLPPLPQGFAFTGETRPGADGGTLYYAENETSENGLVMGVWFDENGAQAEEFETLFTSASGRRRAEQQLPAAYDARNDALLTPIKLQVGNTCWAFSSVACMEANAIKKGLATAQSIDLSEGHLIWFGRNAYFDGESDPRNDGLAAASAANAVNVGGNASYVAGAMENYMGPANESDYPVDLTDANTLAESLQATMRFSDRFVRAFDFAGLHRIVADRENIKKAVLTYGAAEQYYYTENRYYTNRVPANAQERLIPATYYYPTDVATSQINHAVVIVGWDDSFSKENFTGLAQPEHDGAWLCRNSWSTAFGNDGYFWMSYENHGCYGAVNAYELAEKDESVTVQYYDGYGSRDTVDCTAAANIFTASDNGWLSAVSLGAPQNAYSFSVYTGLSATSYPTGGTRIYTQSGSAGGKTVIDVEGNVPLQAGRRYAVVFSGLSEAPVEGVSEDKGGNSYRFTSDMYQSFYEADGKWIDSNRNNKNNLCIRAFEKTQSEPPYTVTFACQGSDLRLERTTADGTVALPEPPAGYAYSFTWNGSDFDGTGVTRDITVRTHCYLPDGTVSESDPCLVEFRCVLCGEEAVPAVKRHTMQTTVIPPCTTSPGYTLNSCVHGDFGTIGDVTLLDGAIGGAIGETLAWQFAGDTLSVAGIGALPNYSTVNPAPWSSETTRAQAKRFVFGEGITSLGAYTVYGFSSLRDITLPASVQTVRETSFGCGSLTALRSVTVSPENTAFRSENGVLLSADGSKLWLYPADKPGAVVQIPEDVTALAAYSMAGSRNVAYLDLSAYTAEIPASFCAGAAALRGVNLPTKATTVGAKAFYNPDGLLDHIYITRVITMPNADVFGNFPKINIDYSTSPVKTYIQKYNDGNYYLFGNHTHAYTAGTETFPGACDVPETTVTLCACGNFSFTQVQAPGHSFGDWEPFGETEHRRVCSNDESHVEIAAHTWDSGTITTEPTCTAAGERTYTCTICGAEKTEPVGERGHNFGDWEPFSETEHRRVCANDASHVETAVHTWDGGTVTTEPTCTADGERTYTCTVCGAEKTEPVGERGHNFGDWEPFSETEHRRVCANDARHVETAAHTWNSGTVTTEPTCTAAGQKAFVCTACGAKKTERISALGHTEPDEDGNCKRCSAHIKDVADPNACPYCGKTHTGLFGWLVRLIHRLLYRLHK